MGLECAPRSPLTLLGSISATIQVVFSLDRLLRALIFLLITYFEVEVHAAVQYNKKEGLQSIEVIVSKTNCSVCG